MLIAPSCKEHVAAHFTIDREAQSLCDFYQKIQTS